jgi:general secretion pathway protein A
MSSGYADKGGAIAVLTGESGSGKTLTLRRFLEELPDNTIYSYINLPNLTKADLIKTLITNFGITAEGGTEVDLKKAAADSPNFEASFGKVLLEDKYTGIAALIAVEQAHTISAGTLLFLFSLIKQSSYPLKIIVSGDTILKEIIAAPQFAEYKELIAVYTEIKALSPAHCKEYISYRANQAGNRLSVSARLAKLIWEVSKGNPALINIIMKRLIVAAYLDRSTVLKEKHLITSAHSLNLSIKTDKKNPLIYAAVAVTITVTALMGADYFFGRTNNPASPLVKSENLTLPIADDSGAEENPFDTAESGNTDNGIYASVGATILNLRSSPDLSASKLAILKEGERVLVLEERAEWLKVELENGQVGWVFKPYIKIDSLN